ncbi:hypothetical protein QBC35DRAFT_464426 [Podospora australis]|uniref:CBM-cenC domain-containing protein n=1 Tax=Podospora australis TaxID=1536484 RepID=A0AAN7AFI8_9PEZI|nr:hypothetical protein QBC35DRAFT_464426 [Podospora australis]
MRFTTAITGGLVVGLAAASSGHRLQQRDAEECVDDALYECFTRSLVQASAYCTASIVSAVTTTDILTFTPTLTVTEEVTETTTTTARGAKFVRRRKRSACGGPPLNCLRNLGSFQSSQLSSACSCIGATAATSTELATVTATDAGTAVVTQITTVTATVGSSFSPQPEPESSTEIVESTSTVEPEPESSTETVPSSTSEPEVSTTETVEASSTEAIPSSTVAPEPSTTESSTETVTPTPTETPEPSSTAAESSTSTSSVVAPPAPIVTNGDFETGTIAGWETSTLAGGSVSAIPYGGNNNHVMALFTSYFQYNAAALAIASQSIACEAGKQYRITYMVSVVSSYTNGNPWSVVLGGVTIASGAGSSMAFTQLSRTHTCGNSPSANQIQFKIASNNNRQARLLVDNVVATLLS